MEIIAISNHKGGVGKTTTTVNLAYALFRQGKRVLIIDSDPQGHTTKHLGIYQPENTLVEALVDNKALKPIEVKGVDIVPSDLDLIEAETALINELSRENILKGKIQELAKNYHYILIDCPPNLGILTLNALVAADKVLIPLAAEYLPLDGMISLINLVKKVKQVINKELHVLGILITRYKECNLHKQVLEQVQTAYPTYLLKHIIRENIKIAEASLAQTDIFNYQPRCNGAEDYTELANLVIKNTVK